MKPEELIGSMTLADGARLSVMVDGYGTPLMSLNGERHPMKRPTAEEISRLFRAAAVHEPHRGVRSAR